ncbi:MAG: hypothetical protein IJ861_11250 [Clostridia bacterium]|nr:hypothetical protein [Clostridia bacterium]
MEIIFEFLFDLAFDLFFEGSVSRRIPKILRYIFRTIIISVYLALFVLMVAVGIIFIRTGSLLVGIFFIALAFGLCGGSAFAFYREYKKRKSQQ